MAEEDVLAAISDATEAIRIQSEKIDALIKLNEQMMKWLLAVVCIIALGKELVSVTRQLIVGHAPTSQSEPR